MERLNDVCKGNCGDCALLRDGKVEMVPCVLDQMFQRMQKQGKELEELKEKLNGVSEKIGVTLAAMPGASVEL